MPLYDEVLLARMRVSRDAQREDLRQHDRRPFPRPVPRRPDRRKLAQTSASWR